MRKFLEGTTIQKLVYILERSLLDLEVKTSQDFVESAAILVHEAMSAPLRRFHTTDHVFQVIDPLGDPILNLSALFHDVVYYNVDGAFTASIEAILSPYITIELGQVFIRRKPPTQDGALPLVLQIFGFNYGQMLAPYGGMNEFLSALVFAKILEPVLDVRDLIGVIACIEASQPFRHEDEEGRSCFELLEGRLLKLSRTRKLGLSKKTLIDLVLKAVRFANLDVNNFAFDDSAQFLDNTWKLLPENNPHLLTNKVYTVRNYRVALEKMEVFFNRVDPSVIFHRYRNEPTSTEFERLCRQAEANVHLAQLYLSGRLLAVGILEALCMVTGGDAPVVMLMGNNSPGNVEQKYEFNDLLSQIPIQLARDINQKLLALLEFEADVASLLDFRRTPLAAFVYKTMGHQQMLRSLGFAKQYFAGEIEAEPFLLSLDSRVVGGIASVCAQMISTRRSRFLAWCSSSPANRVS